jgi:ribosome biogenesis GTPase
MTYDLSSLGWDETFATAYRPLDRSDATVARVLRTELGICTVVGADGVGRASLAGTILLGAVREPGSLPCPGDWVVVRRWPDRRTTVEVVLPRRTALVGRAEPGPERVVAANMDRVAVLEPVRPAPDVACLGRLLAIARASGAEPVLVLTGCDAVPDPAAVVCRVRNRLPGVRVLAVGLQSGAGLDELRGLVTAGHTLALLGHGTSALVDALAGTSVIPARALRGPVAGAALVPVPGGGAVLDVQGSGAAGVEPAGGVLAAAAVPAGRAPARLTAVVGGRPAGSGPRR